jgi:hypothetical protein
MKRVKTAKINKLNRQTVRTPTRERTNELGLHITPAGAATYPKLNKLPKRIYCPKHTQMGPTKHKWLTKALQSWYNSIIVN